MSDELSPEVLKVLDRVKKLLNLAAKNPNEAEATAAQAKAQDLLDQYNLDAATVERAGAAADGKREEAKVAGGFYTYQRELWQAVAQLNFCLYWTQVYYETRPGRVYIDGRGSGTKTVLKRMRSLRHRLIGRVVNTRTSIVMAQYLESAIDRVCRERCEPGRVHQFSNWAVSFRKGAAANIVERLAEARDAKLAAERRRESEASMAGVSTATALTLSDYVKQEQDANLDFIYGEGWSARQAAWRAERAAQQAAEEAAYTAWAKEHPEEAAQKEREAEAEAEKWYRRHRSRGGSGPRDDTDYSAFKAGYQAGADVALHQQMDAPGKAKRLGRS